MKRWILTAAIALAALPALAQQQEAYPSYIQVSGRSELEIVPDEFYLSITLNERDTKGRVTVEEQLRQMTASLRGLGVDVQKQLKVADMNSEYLKRKGSLTQAEYRLELHSAAQVAEVYAALDKLGISNISISKVSHTRIEELKDQVRVAAIRDARRNADTLAEAIGQQAGRCFYIYDPNNDVLPVFYNAPLMMRAGYDAAMEDTSAAPELDFRSIKLQYNVQAKFVLQ